MIGVNLNKAKEIAHNARRAKREELFKPLDVQATIPMYAEQAEVKRAEIRKQFEEVQIQMDAAQSPEQLKEILQQVQAIEQPQK